MTKDKLNYFQIQIEKTEDQSSRKRKHASMELELNWETATRVNPDLSGFEG